MRAFVCLVLAASISFTANANDGKGKSALDLMMVSKMTGVCGVMPSRWRLFQSSTQMSGGNEFIARFWRTEFARLGISQETFLKECKESIATYNQLWQSFEQLGKVILHNKANSARMSKNAKPIMTSSLYFSMPVISRSNDRYRSRKLLLIVYNAMRWVTSCILQSTHPTIEYARCRYA